MSRFGTFLVLIIILLIYLLNTGGAFADVTSVLLPINDGGEDGGDWTNEDGVACGSVDCSVEVGESSGFFCGDSDGEASYIRSSANGASQTFDVDESVIPDNSIITQIDITVCAMLVQRGAQIQTRYCVDSSCVNSSGAIGLSSSFSGTTQSFAGLNIIKNVDTDIEIGVINIASKTARVSKVSAVITYSPNVPHVPPADTTAPLVVSDLATSSAIQITLEDENELELPILELPTLELPMPEPPILESPTIVSSLEQTSPDSETEVLEESFVEEASTSVPAESRPIDSSDDDTTDITDRNIFLSLIVLLVAVLVYYFVQKNRSKKIVR